MYTSKSTALRSVIKQSFKDSVADNQRKPSDNIGDGCEIDLAKAKSITETPVSELLKVIFYFVNDKRR